MSNVLASKRPWNIYREPWMDFYLIRDANDTVIAQVSSYKDARKPQSFQLQPDLDLAHANATLICNVINQG